MRINHEKNIKVFISYCKESEKHSKNVLELTDRLRKDGIDAILDQYEQAPVEGWQRWMENKISESNFVLIVCTKIYFTQLKGLKPSKNGKGIRFESLVIYQEIYDNNSMSQKFIPITFKKDDIKFIPEYLKAFQYHVIDTDEGYEELYRRLTNQPLIVKPDRGEIKQLPTGINIDHSLKGYVNDSIKSNYNIPEKDKLSETTAELSKMEIELRINRDFNKYTEEEKEQLLRAIRELLGIDSDLRIKKIRPGSVLITLELSPHQAEKLFWMVKSGYLAKHGVIDAELKTLQEFLVSEKEVQNKTLYKERMESKIWKVFVSLGIPGLALGVFYMLFNTFHFTFPVIPTQWVGPIIVLYMIITAAIVFYSLGHFAPMKTIPAHYNGDESSGGLRESQIDIKDLREYFQSTIKNEQSKYVKKSYGEYAEQCFTWDDLNEFRENRITTLIEHRLETDAEFISYVKLLNNLPPDKRRKLFSELERIYKPTWAELGYISSEGQTDAGQTAEKMISNTIVKFIKKLSG